MDEQSLNDTDGTIKSQEKQDNWTYPRIDIPHTPCAEQLKTTLFQLNHILERHAMEAKTTAEILQEINTWMRDYINRSMPIKSHLIILIGSLSILASFAAVIKLIDKLIQ